MEAIGSDGRRWFRFWTSPSLDGAWTPLLVLCQMTNENPRSDEERQALCARVAS